MARRKTDVGSAQEARPHPMGARFVGRGIGGCTWTDSGPVLEFSNWGDDEGRASRTGGAKTARAMAGKDLLQFRVLLCRDSQAGGNEEIPRDGVRRPDRLDPAMG